MPTRIGSDTESEEFTVDDRGALLSVVDAMSTTLSCTPTDLEPIYHDVDPPALESVIDHPGHQHLYFESNGLAVTISSDGRIALAPLDDGASAAGS
ncbi:HalOD1 output domain-containing protein [Natronosalvus vescus]|uniref:HalOD1 output domain-containing protein n=1 Tax=Natronosalvus vescus TaxID=2953881 RepID=UPI0020908925|nr:HalOD1 output domain-containing protein [Natronosalvus vescus]